MSCVAQSCCPPAIFDNPVPKAGDQLFGNTAQTAEACCGPGLFVVNGGCKTATVEANTLYRATQLQADADAYDLAYSIAQSELVCSCANLVPNMTDYEEPSGEVLYSSDSVANAAWHAFDGNLRTESEDPFWHAGSTEDPTFIGYRFPTATVVQTYRIYPYADAGTGDNPTAWVFEGSNDGTNWTELDSQEDQTEWTVGLGVDYPFTNSTAYAYYRLRITEVEHERPPTSFPGLTPAIGELQLVPCHPEWFEEDGNDPVLGPPNPPTNFGMKISNAGGITTGIFTIPDLVITTEVIIGAGSGTPPGYAYITVKNYADTWVAGVYAVNDKVLHNHQFYQANSATTGADVPGVSPKWDAMAPITWKVWWRDDRDNPTFAESTPPSSPPYLLGRSWWALAFPDNGPTDAPDNLIRFGVKIDDYYGAFAANFYFYIAATAGGTTVYSHLIQVPVPLPV